MWLIFKTSKDEGVTHLQPAKKKNKTQMPLSSRATVDYSSQARADCDFIKEEIETNASSAVCQTESQIRIFDFIFFM